MNISKYEYHAPRTVEEACALLDRLGEGTVVMAGGTDLLIKIRHGLLNPEAVVDLKRIKDLDGISFDRRKGLRIGATALLADVASHRDIQRRYPAVAYAAGETANVQIRNMGTVGGNLCNAAPSADNAPTLTAMEATVTLVSTHGERHLKLEEFFQGPGKTAAKTGEVLTSIFVPLPPSRSGASYQHISARGKVDIAAVGVGVMLTANDTRCETARIVLGAVAPVPMRARKSEDLLQGATVTPGLAEKAGLEASREAKPISDVRASARYRKETVAVLAKRAILEAWSRAVG